MEKRLKTFFKRHDDHSPQTTHVPQKGEASNFYFACRNGDIATVKNLISTLPYDRINELQPNGSTPLHAATFYGHEEVVRLLLLKHGCRREQMNLYGFTAYEEAQTDEIRALYRRYSDHNRFAEQSDENNKTFQIVSSSSTQRTDDIDDMNDELIKPNEQWLIGYDNYDEIKQQLDGLTGIKTLLQTRFGRRLIKQAIKSTLGKKDCGYTEEEYAYMADELFSGKALKKILDEHITRDHPEYEHACCLINKFIEQDNIEALLTLYSMETPFYHQLTNRINPLGFPLFMHLPDLKPRYYQGQCYRGIRITRDEFNEYRWALKNKDSVISTVKFASTSIDRYIAEQFAVVEPIPEDRIRVLLIFNFPQPCDTAINLCKIPEYQLPCISNFESEHEVLVAPRTFFRVRNIETNPINGLRVIDLENISGVQRTALGTLAFFLKQEIKSRIRH